MSNLGEPCLPRTCFVLGGIVTLEYVWLGSLVPVKGNCNFTACKDILYHLCASKFCENSLGKAHILVRWLGVHELFSHIVHVAEGK